MLHTIRKKLSNLFAYKYKCPCGYKTNNRKDLVSHIETHPDSLGSIDISTGLVNW